MNIKSIQAASKIKPTLGPVVQSSSGAIIPFWLDNRRCFSHPEVFETWTDDMAKIVRGLRSKGHKIDILAGVSKTGIPLATAISLKTKIPFVYVEPERKKFLDKRLVEGDFKKGNQAILIDDSMGLGGTKKKFVENAETDGLKIKHVMVVFEAWPNSNQEIKDYFKRKGITFHCLFNRDEWMDYLLKTKKISREAREIEGAYCDNPKTWHKDKTMWQRFLKWKKKCIKTGKF